VGLVTRVCAIDIGKAGLVACVRVPHDTNPDRRVQEVREYPTVAGAPQADSPAARCDRYRRSLVREQTREKQRLEKMLEDAQIKLDSVNGHQHVYLDTTNPDGIMTGDNQPEGTKR